ncbi:MAG: Flap-structured DNA-binding and RNA-binding protein [Chaenotheca gracillima]|nr:MAG: Flap-structured DNA-binding and RNA-binding protein [Chaenotheca gracillima]
MSSHNSANRNSTPDASAGSSLRPPSSRAVGSGHHLRASADMAAYSSSPLSSRARPSSDVYYNQSQQPQSSNNHDDAAEKAAQQWIADIDQYESTLEEMAAATLDQEFKDELSAIEQWFRVLSEPERTAALYALLQQTTQVQIRFFIEVLKQMSQSHPMSGVLSPANFESDPMSNRMSDAMIRYGVGDRNSLVRPPPSPGVNKRNSGLDPQTINHMFPDAAAALATQKAKFAQENGKAPESNRNSAVYENRSSLAAPSISAPDRKESSQPPPSPWRPTSNSGEHPFVARIRSPTEQHPPMGQFSQPPPSAGLRSPRPTHATGTGNMQSTSINAPDNRGPEIPMLSPFNGGSGNWASMVNTPMAANFQQAPSSQADMVANAAAMKLAAMSTLSNRINLEDPKKYRRGRSNESHNDQRQQPLSPGMPNSNMPGTNVVMVNEHGQVLTAQQVNALQAQQAAAMSGRRSRPNSPGISISAAGPNFSNVGYQSPQTNGFLTAYDGNAFLSNQLSGLNLGQQGPASHGGSHEGYLSDHSDMGRGRSPRGRRGSSKPPEDPTDPKLLSDIPQWLRTLRLHKYTDQLKDLKWTDLVELDDAALEARGVNALGARRKMLKVFEQIREAKTDGKIQN